MTPVTMKIEEKYDVTCYYCQAIFDALSSIKCSCVTSDPTLVCPCCQRCFCKASSDYKSRFWEAAPTILWRRRNEEGKKPFVVTNPEPENVVRPLVLIVEDEFLILRAAVQAVQNLGFGTILARNGVEAIALVREYIPDMILSDMLMPRMDGLQMCRFIKSDPDLLKIKVVLMTSLYTKSKQRMALSREFQPDEYLIKPLEPGQLNAVLRKLLIPQN